MRYTEKQVSSALLDRPEFLSSPTKVFICSTPRSGSYLLCRYMINAGLGVPHEYFNPIIMRDIAPRLELGPSVAPLRWRPRNRRDRLPLPNPARVAEEDFLRKYLSAIIPRRCQNGIFAAKIHFEHLGKVLENSTGRKLLSGGTFIYLYRENLLKQAVSAHFAHLTGRWGIDDTATTAPAKEPNFLDVELLDQTLQRLADEDRGWRVFLARNGLSPLSISYEQLCKDPYAFLEVVARRLDFDPAKLSRGYSEANAGEGGVGGQAPSKDEVAKRYVVAFHTLSEILIGDSTRRGRDAEFQSVGGSSGL
jgi:LPS sulfotransferase NodH